jgi:hypothetical protein
MSRVLMQLVCVRQWRHMPTTENRLIQWLSFTQAVCKKLSQWRDRTADIGLTPFQVLGPHHNQLDQPGVAYELNHFCNLHIPVRTVMLRVAAE